MNNVDSIATDKVRIRALNDRLRQTFVGGQVALTQGVRALSAVDLSTLFKLLQSFSDFSADNDPEEEHDFGALRLNGETYFFKIDYYDPSLEYASADPSDPARTARVLTLLRADEY